MIVLGSDTTNCVSKAGDIVGNDICLLVSWIMDLDFPRNFGIIGALRDCLLIEVKENLQFLHFPEPTYKWPVPEQELQFLNWF